MPITSTDSLTLQDLFSTTLSASVSTSDTVINLTSVPTGSEGFLTIFSSAGVPTEIIYYNSKGASTVTCPSATAGSGRGMGGTTVTAFSSGATVKQTVNSDYFKELQNGNANTGLHTWFDEGTFDYTASGGVWTGDSLGSTRNASMTAATCYIDGRRLSVGAVTARSFTASKDTYIDVLRSGNTGTLVYTEVANNAASPALAANSIRIGIIVTGATSIAAAGSVNQGQPDRVLPIASSIPYSVTDSLGNLIYNTTPTPTIIGYRQITANFTTASTTSVQITGLTCPVIVPAGRKVKIVCNVSQVQGSVGGQGGILTLWDGVVNSGTQVSQYNVTAATVVLNNGGNTAAVQASSGSKTYNAGATSTGGGSTVTIGATSAGPAFISVELV